MSNFYHKYGNQRVSKSYVPYSDSQRAAHMMTNPMSQSQFNYYTELRNFAENRGLDLSFLPKVPRNSSNCRSHIHAIITLMRRAGIDREFFDGSGKHEQAQND